MEYVRNNTITGKIITRKMLTIFSVNCCQDIKFVNCSIKAENLNKSGKVFDFFKFYNCVFEGCEFSGSNSQDCLYFIGCVFKECSFIFMKSSGFHFTNSKFIRSFKGNPNLIKTGCKFHVIEFNKCELEGIICDWGGLDTYEFFKYDDLIYIPTNDRIRKDGTINEDPIITRLCPLKCPEEGSFIGWKQIMIKKIEIFDEGMGKHETIIPAPALCKLKIPSDALRSSGTDVKCRCDKAKVLEITELIDNGKNYMREKTNIKYKKGYSINDGSFEYKVGKTVKCRKKFDNDRFHECSSGIHFFMSKRDAMDY